MKNINSKTALNNALTSVGISDGNYCCEYICLESGYYRMIVSTLMLRYEFYVDACTGEVCGINTEPVIDVTEQAAELRISA